jgi:uncharacterized membrane protein
MTRIGGLVRLASLAATVGWILDSVLRHLTHGPPKPFDSLIVIDAPIEKVWSELADIEGQPRWMSEMKAVRLLTPSPVGVGTRGEATVRILGMAVTDPVEVTAFEPPTRFAIRHEGTFTGGGEFSLERGADGTTTIVRWDERLVAPVMPHLWAILARPIVGSIFQADLRRLRDLVERGSGA